MSENEYGFESVSITVAGIDYVENTLGKEEPVSFFSQLVAERPEVAEKLGYWAHYINAHSDPRENIRKITYDLLEHILNEFVISDSSVETKKNEKPQEKRFLSWEKDRCPLDGKTINYGVCSKCTYCGMVSIPPNTTLDVTICDFILRKNQDSLSETKTWFYATLHTTNLKY